MARIVGRIRVMDGVEALEARRRRALIIALEYLLQKSRELVPHQEGVLELSGRVVVADDGSQGAVTYDTPYAVRQHEDLTLRHDPGRQAKYLEEPLYREAETMRRLIHRELSRVTR